MAVSKHKNLLTGSEPPSTAAGRRRGQAQIQSLARGLEVLSLFRPGRVSMTVEEIATEISVPKSSAYRLVATLRDRGYLRKLPGGEGYTVGAVLVRFGEVVRNSSQLHRVALPVMEALANASRETAVLAIRNRDRGVVVDKVDSPEMMRWIPDVGWSYPLHVAATGKIFLAWMPAAERRKYLEGPLDRATEQTIVDRDALEAELATVRKSGFAIACEEALEGGTTVAAPIFDAHGRVVACIGVAGPAPRLTRQRAEEIAPLVIEHARQLSRELGADEPRS